MNYVRKGDVINCGAAGRAVVLASGSASLSALVRLESGLEVLVPRAEICPGPCRIVISKQGLCQDWQSPMSPSNSADITV